MTTAAYRAGILAADTQMTWGDGSRRRVSKIVRLPDGSLFAGSGNAPAIKKMQRWAEAGFPVKPKPRFATDIAVDCILVKPDGSAWLIDRDAEPEELKEEFTAIGSGSHFAIGAMACGKTAEEAVEIAARFDSETSIPVETMKL